MNQVFSKYRLAVDEAAKISLIMQQLQSKMIGQKTKLIEHQAQLGKELFKILHESSLIQTHADLNVS